jgi:archaetidylinositol phosphate synthase
VRFGNTRWRHRRVYDPVAFMLDSLLTQHSGLRSLQAQIARIFHRVGISANLATIVGAVFGISAGVLFARGDTAVGIIALATSGGLDALDGTIAREFEGATALGGILDLTMDRVVEVMVLLGLVLPHFELRLPALIVLATWYVNITAFMATGAAFGAGEKLIHYPPGLVERTEALLFFLLVALAPGMAAYTCYVYATLEAATAIQRLAYAWHHLPALSDE